MTINAYWLLYFACLAAAMMATFLAPVPARADFFDDSRKAFTSDIPHFFQDDIPCFFGGEPTSGAKKSCKSPGLSAKSPTDKRAGIPANTTNNSAGSRRPNNSAQQ